MGSERLSLECESEGQGEGLKSKGCSRWSNRAGRWGSVLAGKAFPAGEPAVEGSACWRSAEQSKQVTDSALRSNAWAWLERVLGQPLPTYITLEELLANGWIL